MNWLCFGNLFEDNSCLAWKILTGFPIALSLYFMIRKVDMNREKFDVNSYYAVMRTPDFLSSKCSCDKTKSSLEKAFDIALDIRKFEIDMYWKRATYFWALMAICFTGIVMLKNGALYPLISFSLSCLGLFLSVAFWLINRGSKFWQQNWEAHVDLLGRKICGPLYQYVIISDDIKKCSPWSEWPFSVSKVNMLVSFFLIVFWISIIYAQFTIFDGKFFANEILYQELNVQVTSRFLLNSNIRWFLLTITSWGIFFLLYFSTTSEIESKISNGFMNFFKWEKKGNQKESDKRTFSAGSKTLYVRKDWWNNNN